MDHRSFASSLAVSDIVLFGGNNNRVYLPWMQGGCLLRQDFDTVDNAVHGKGKGKGKGRLRKSDATTTFLGSWRETPVHTLVHNVERQQHNRSNEVQ